MTRFLGVALSIHFRIDSSLALLSTNSNHYPRSNSPKAPHKRSKGPQICAPTPELFEYDHASPPNDIRNNYDYYVAANSSR